MTQKPEKPKGRGGAFTPNIVNKKARFQFVLLEKLEAGLALLGSEIKSVRAGQATLDDAYCRVRDGELFLIGATIAPYEHSNLLNHDPARLRKLLVHRREIKKLEAKAVQKGFTIVPLRIYFTRGRAKIEIAVAQGKTFGDKREKIRDREMKRDIDRAMRRRR